MACILYEKLEGCIWPQAVCGFCNEKPNPVFVEDGFGFIVFQQKTINPKNLS